VNNQEQIVTGAEFEHGTDEIHGEYVAELSEIVPEMLSVVTGGPAGSVTPDGGNTVPPVEK
jgi:hypothetical protein